MKNKLKKKKVFLFQRAGVGGQEPAEIQVGSRSATLQLGSGLSRTEGSHPTPAAGQERGCPVLETWFPEPCVESLWCLHPRPLASQLWRRLPTRLFLFYFSFSSTSPNFQHHYGSLSPSLCLCDPTGWRAGENTSDLPVLAWRPEI